MSEATNHSHQKKKKLIIHSTQAKHSHSMLRLCPTQFSFLIPPNYPEYTIHWKIPILSFYLRKYFFHYHQCTWRKQYTAGKKKKKKYNVSWRKSDMGNQGRRRYFLLQFNLLLMRVFWNSSFEDQHGQGYCSFQLLAGCSEAYCIFSTFSNKIQVI